MSVINESTNTLDNLSVDALARQMYDSRDFSTMPILADALFGDCFSDALEEHTHGQCLTRPQPRRNVGPNLPGKTDCLHCEGLTQPSKRSREQTAWKVEQGGDVTTAPGRGTLRRGANRETQPRVGRRPRQVVGGAACGAGTARHPHPPRTRRLTPVHAHSVRQ